MWWVINQIQIFLLLILSGVFLPIDVKKVITGLKFALTPLDYIPFNKAQLYSDVLSNFNFETSNPTLEEIGINSDSSIINTYSIFLNIIYMVPIHLLIICLRYMAKKLNPTKKCSFAYISKWIVEKWFIIMTFGYYIRLFMEMNQLMLISSIYEINQFDTTIKLRIVSLAVAFVVLTIWLLIIWAFFWLSISNLQLLNNHKLSECFSGIKEKRSSRLYR